MRRQNGPAPPFSIVALQKKVEVAWWLAVKPAGKGVRGPPATLNSQGIAHRKSEVPQIGIPRTVLAGPLRSLTILSTGGLTGVPVVALPAWPGPKVLTGCTKLPWKPPAGVTTLATVPSPNTTP